MYRTHEVLRPQAEAQLELEAFFHLNKVIKLCALSHLVIYTLQIEDSNPLFDM